jgi:hypothetical protein
LSKNDPTDQALAAIASILDQPPSPREDDTPVVEEKIKIHQPEIEELLQETLQGKIHASVPHEPVPVDEPVSIAHDPLDSEADGYFKYGPGPLAAIRFKWAVRRENGDAYYVDETIGENSPPVVTGPMTARAAIQLVDDRESEAHQRFERIKSEMTVRNMASHLVENNGDKH